MNLSLSAIPKNGINIHELIDFDEKYIKNTDIKELNQVEVNGKIIKNYNLDIVLELKAKGNMTLIDAYSLKNISYPFFIEISEKINEFNEEIQEYFDNKQNTLDIMGILWENIILEVPMRLTVTDERVLPVSGDGWELMKEKKETIDPRLAPLRELLDKEKE